MRVSSPVPGAIRNAADCWSFFAEIEAAEVGIADRGGWLARCLG
jgi:hypothetical protein